MRAAQASSIMGTTPNECVCYALEVFRISIVDSGEGTHALFLPWARRGSRSLLDKGQEMTGNSGTHGGPGDDDFVRCSRCKEILRGLKASTFKTAWVVGDCCGNKERMNNNIPILGFQGKIKKTEARLIAWEEKLAEREKALDAREVHVNDMMRLFGILEVKYGQLEWPSRDLIIRIRRAGLTQVSDLNNPHSLVKACEFEEVKNEAQEPK